MSWHVAHRVAQIAAVQAQHDLHVDPDRCPVLVAPAIHAAGIELVWQPLDRLFGMYLHVGDSRGILVNAGLPRAARRHTAAHELAHHWLRHPPHPGTPCAVDSGTSRLPQRAVWTPEERVAEAFADWFLMPRKAVLAAIAHLRLTALAGPADAYQVSLMLGTTYRATVRHLYSLRMIPWTVQRAWSAVTPAVLKRQLLTGALPSTRDVDVWSIMIEPTPGKQATRYLSPGDRIVLPRTLLVEPDALACQDGDHDRVVLTAPDAPGTHHLQLTAAAGPITLPLVVESRPRGLYIPGTDNSDPISPEVSA
jgi:IrrE N-terminal-like domain